MSLRSERALLTRQYGKIAERIEVKIDNLPYEIELRMRKKDGGYRFTAVHLQAENNLGRFDAIVETCEKPEEAVQKVREQMLASIRTEWTQVIKVEVCTSEKEECEDDPRPWRRRELDIEIERYEIGTRPDGSQCHRELCPTWKESEEGSLDWTQRGHLRTGPPDSRYWKGGDCTVIPYTEETWNALIAILSAMDDLCRRVRTALTEGEEQAILDRIHNVPLLLGSSKEDG